MTTLLPDGRRAVVTRDLFRRAFLLINAVASNEDPDNEMYQDALESFNDLLEQWSTDGMKVYGSSNQNFTAIPGLATYTIGVGGDFNTERPIAIEGATCIQQGVSTPIKVISQAEYDMISMKSLQSALTERLLYVNEHPLGKITVHPVPTEAVTWSLRMKRLLQQVDNLDVVLDLPPGYFKALRYNLAVDLWPEYPNTITDIGSVKKIAVDSLADIQRANTEDQVVRFDDIPNVTIGRSWDWREG